jgi:putative ABC transport system permease protein
MLTQRLSFDIREGTTDVCGITAHRRRTASADASFAALRMHDLRVSLASGSYARQGTLMRALDAIRGRSAVTASEERLVVPTQVDASTSRRSIIVSGR